MKCKHVWHLLIKINVIILFFNATVIYAFSESLLLVNERVCSSIDIRKQSHLNQLNECTVIEGDLYIVTVTLWEHQTFPLLKEITGSLVIYYAMGIKTLETYFPNLILIRGQTLAYNYAVVIKETSLLYIGLVNLRLILFGGVRIDSNPLLCYTSSINWPSIVKQQGASIKTINMRNICPDFCPKNCSQALSFSSHPRDYCWSHKICQNICSSRCINRNLSCFMNDPNQCCHSECLAGCYGHGDDKCVSCKNVMFQGRCFEKCPNHYYKFKNRRCISKSECTRMSSQSSTDYRRNDFYAIEDHSCVKQCSVGKERDLSSGQCVVCGFNCSKKYCGKILIHSINDLTEVDGCYSIEEININIIEGGSSLSELLSKAFSKLTVIDNSLEIIRSSSITSLSFLKSLKLIKGNMAKQNGQKNDTSENPNKSIVFKVYDNENLVEISNDKLPEEKLNITIWYGSVSFNLNRKLCPEKILSFLKNNIHSQVEITNLDEKIINISNGDMAFCKHEKLNVTIKAISDSSFIVECKSKITDFLLQDSGSAALFMLKETEKNVSQYELFNSCFKQNWQTIEGTLGKPVLIDGLKSAKRYAFYVEAIRSRVENWLEISDVIYITTKRKNPSPPIDLRTETLSHSEIRLTWSPPLNPNGVVTQYLIWFRSFEIYHKEFSRDNFCPYKRTYYQKHSSWTEKKINAAPNNDANSLNICDCNSCVTLCNQNQLKRNFDQDNFDFQLLDHYVSQSFQKQNSIPTSNWVPRVSEDIEIKNFTTKEYNNTEDTNIFVTRKHSTVQSWPFPQNSSSQPIQMFRVSAGVSFYVFTNLHHYTEYLFEIQACQDPVDNEPLKMENNSYFENKRQGLKDVCSLKSSVSAHTLPKKHMDNINETLISSLAIGDTARITWTEPSAPNGLVLNFLLRYRDLPVEKNDVWLDQLCIPRLEWLNGKEVLSSENHSSNETFPSLKEMILNVQHSGSYVIKNLRPGKYEYQIKSISIPGNGSWTKSFYFVIPHYSVFKSYQPFFIAGSIVIVLFLIATICLVYYYHRKRQLARTNWISTNPDYWIIYEIDEWEIDRKDIDMIEWNFPLGRGSFGIVYKGLLKNLTTPAKHQVLDMSFQKDMYVAIKTLNTNSTILERREFINEACYMKQFQTYHLVKLFGIVSKVNQSENDKRFSSKSLYCHRFSLLGRIRNSVKWDTIKKITIFKYGESKNRKPGDQLEDKSAAQLISFKTTISQHFQKMPLVIMELMEYGDLAGYLRKQGEEGEGFISENQTCLWALQIADGMLYLAEMKFVHRDLAARNCMINSKLIIKIGDFGMARDIYYDCYYKKEGKGRLPIRWMAPESLQSAYFTTNSDVWSYGVVLWEISTLASLPYLGMSHHEVIQFVTNGGTLLTNGGSSCPKLIWNIVECCWLYYADKRPTFLEITQKLERYSDDDFRTNSYYFKQKNVYKQNMNLNLFGTQTDTENSIENSVYKS